jgi:hypothetical protein
MYIEWPTIMWLSIHRRGLFGLSNFSYDRFYRMLEVYACISVLAHLEGVNYIRVTCGCEVMPVAVLVCMVVISPLSKSHIQPDDGPIYGPKHVVVYLTMH